MVFSLQRDDFDEEDDQEENSDIPFIQNEDGEIFNSKVIQLDTDAGTGLPIDDEINDDSTDDIEEEINTEREPDDFFDEIRINQNESEPVKLPKQRRCLSHLLNLIANYFVNSLGSRAKKAHVKTFSKLQAI